MRKPLIIRIAGYSAIVAVIGVAQFFMYGRLAVNFSDSTPHHVYWRRFSVPPVVGGYASFFRTVPEEDGVRDITKLVACGPGDAFSVKGLEYYCNGRLIAQAKLTTRNGIVLRPFMFEGKVPPKMFFALGHSFRQEGGRMVDDSYDSRYFGFVRFDESWKAVPLL
jgi:type IV secretory pathway protease TraF